MLWLLTSRWTHPVMWMSSARTHWSRSSHLKSHARYGKNPRVAFLVLNEIALLQPQFQELQVLGR